jgi:hypothetical protein
MTPTGDKAQLDYVSQLYGALVSRKLDLLIEADDLLRSFTEFDARNGRRNHQWVYMTKFEKMDKAAELRWKAHCMNQEILRLDELRNELSGLPQLKYEKAKKVLSQM